MQEHKLENINNELFEYTKKLILNMPIVSNLFRDEKISQASKVFSQIIEGLEWIDKYISIIASGDNKIIVNHKNVTEIRNDFMHTVDNLLKYYQSHKYLEVADSIDNKLTKDLETYLKILDETNK